jgi:hypothetical protein
MLKDQIKKGCAFRAYIPALNGEVLGAYQIKTGTRPVF